METVKARVILALLAAVNACGWACSRTAVATPASAAKTTTPAPDPATPCHAGTLPRLDATDVVGGAGALLAASRRGGVAVSWDGARAALIEGCTLDGAYVVIPGRGGKGTFRATNRVLFRVDEITGDCRRATHVVAAVATADGDGKIGMRAILSPLPCPPVAEASPALGCTGKGQTGPQRRARAARLAEKVGGQTRGPKEPRPDPAGPLSVFALAPDDVLGLMAMDQIQEMAGGGLGAQARFLAGQYYMDDRVDPPAVRLRKAKERTAVPTLDWRGPSTPILREPVFLYCFTDLVNPDIRFGEIPAGGSR